MRHAPQAPGPPASPALPAMNCFAAAWRLTRSRSRFSSRSRRSRSSLATVQFLQTTTDGVAKTFDFLTKVSGLKVLSKGVEVSPQLSASRPMAEQAFAPCPRHASHGR